MEESQSLDGRRAAAAAILVISSPEPRPLQRIARQRLWHEDVWTCGCGSRRCRLVLVSSSVAPMFEAQREVELQQRRARRDVTREVAVR